MKPLSKGDPCRVRLQSGEVVDAVYDEPMSSYICKKHHHVEINNLPMVAGKYGRCRFVGPACVLAPVEVSNDQETPN